jgi:hypothetical protein
MGVTTRVGFRNRPIHPDYAVGQQISKSLRNARSYQRQHVPLPSTYVATDSLGSGSFTGYATMPLMPADTVVTATVLVTIMTGGTYDVEINGTLQGANLGGPWTAAPNQINVKPFAVPAAETPPSGRIYFRLKNTGAGAITQIEFQPMIVVLR